MPNDNKISAMLSAQDKAAILAAFATIKAKLPFLINLTPTERRRMPTIGPERVAMDAAFAQAMAQHPELVPAFVDTAELALDRALWASIGELLACAKEVCEGIEDTHHVTGSDILMAYLSFYQNVRQAARRGVVGIDSVYNTLRQYFPSGNGGGQPTPQPTP